MFGPIEALNRLNTLTTELSILADEWEESCDCCDSTGKSPHTHDGMCEACAGTGLDQNTHSATLKAVLLRAAQRQKETAAVLLVGDLEWSAHESFYNGEDVAQVRQATCPCCAGYRNAVSDIDHGGPVWAPMGLKAGHLPECRLAAVLESNELRGG